MTLNLMDLLLRVKYYLDHRLSAFRQAGKNRHLPFIRDFMQPVLKKELKHEDEVLIRQERQQLLNKKSKRLITVYQSSDHKDVKIKTLPDIVRKSSITERQGAILYQLSQKFNPSVIVELGTSTGLSTLYLALGNREAKITTIESNTMLCSVASAIFSQVKLDHVRVLNRMFKDALPLLEDEKMERPLVFIDGDHTYEGTKTYFNFFINKITVPFILVFHDINWSRGMHRIWKEIQLHPKVKTTVDLYEMGIVIHDDEFEKGHFVLRCD